jgi:hypothetical protein
LRFCTSCGEPSRPGTNFCTACGTQVAATAHGAGAASGAVPQRPWPAAQAQSGTAEGVASADTITHAVVHDQPGSHRSASPPRALRIAGAALVLLVVIAGAGYGVASAVRGDEAAVPTAGSGSAAPPTEPAAPRAPSESPTDAAPPSSAMSSGAPSSAPTRPLQPVSVSADCTAPPAQDSLQRTVTYEPWRVTDGVQETAWRCTGSAVGQRLYLHFDAPVTVTSVGLVPGYDKVDPADGIDRFTENRTITAVRWSFDDGSSVRQEIPSPSRDLAQVTLDSAVRTTTVVLQVASTGNDGARRDYTAISEVEILGF